ncbi:hypothetical protein [Sphingobacterium anhuiense]|uniref:Uncharacterized protein n=1 Tax=Sphingobacterium anhuiense TaxID=493780 RepID=A0ABW5YXA8_9SPHI
MKNARGIFDFFEQQTFNSQISCEIEIYTFGNVGKQFGLAMDNQTLTNESLGLTALRSLYLSKLHMMNRTIF